MKKLMDIISCAAACSMMTLYSSSFTSYAQDSIQEEATEAETVQITIIPDNSEDTSRLFSIASVCCIIAAAGGGTYYIHKKKKK